MSALLYIRAGIRAYTRAPENERLIVQSFRRTRLLPPGGPFRAIFNRKEVFIYD